MQCRLAMFSCPEKYVHLAQTPSSLPLLSLQALHNPMHTKSRCSIPFESQDCCALRWTGGPNRDQNNSALRVGMFLNQPSNA